MRADAAVDAAVVAGAGPEHPKWRAPRIMAPHATRLPKQRQPSQADPATHSLERECQRRAEVGHRRRRSEPASMGASLIATVTPSPSPAPS